MAIPNINYQTGNMGTTQIPTSFPANTPAIWSVITDCDAGSTATNWVAVPTGYGSIVIIPDGANVALAKVFTWDYIKTVRVFCPGTGVAGRWRMLCAGGDCCGQNLSYSVNVQLYTTENQPWQSFSYNTANICPCDATCETQITALADAINADVTASQYFTATVVNGTTLDIVGVSATVVFSVTAGNAFISAQQVNAPEVSWGTGQDIVDWIGDAATDAGVVLTEDYTVYTFDYWEPVPANAQTVFVPGNVGYAYLTQRVTGAIIVPSACTTIKSRLCTIFQDPNSVNMFGKIPTCSCTDFEQNTYYCMFRAGTTAAATIEASYVITNPNLVTGSVVLVETRTINGQEISLYSMTNLGTGRFRTVLATDVCYESTADGCGGEAWDAYINGDEGIASGGVA